ncbi:MAG: family transcriptional regulator, cyclic receptor protein [Chloroflexota bacterium]|nr:family transcriptional regulator, cyclic receptor protein [Chloroflexota bacterium]
MWQEELGAGVDEAHITAGALIFRAGQLPKIALVVAGIVRVFISTQLGRQMTIRYARAGDLIGLSPYLAGTDQWNAEAITDVSVKVLSFDHLRNAGAHDPELPWRIAQHVAAVTVDALRTVADASGQPITVRVARHLREMALRGPDGRTVVHVSHQRLADAVGTVREVVSRELTAFRAEGVIDRTAGSVRVIDEDRLASLAAGQSSLRAKRA